MSITYIPVHARRAVIRRAQNRCEYCLLSDAYSAFPFHVDHIIPESKGGTTTEDNLAYSCGCNHFKSSATEGVDLQTGDIAPLFHPRRDDWQSNFRRSENALEIEGITATGRVTVTVLKMNRVALMNLRRLLILKGEHPASTE
jgi:hypothetical protein